MEPTPRDPAMGAALGEEVARVGWSSKFGLVVFLLGQVGESENGCAKKSGCSTRELGVREGYRLRMGCSRWRCLSRRKIYGIEGLLVEADGSYHQRLLGQHNRGS